LRNGHDDLRLAGGLQEIAEADDRRDHIGWGSRYERTDAVMAPEAGIHGLQAESAGPLNTTATRPYPLVLGDDELIDTIRPSTAGV
jgi:hypothetical protein